MKILILLGTGMGIGNTILLTPAVQAFKMNNPETEVFTYGNSLSGEILEGIGARYLAELTHKMYFDVCFILCEREKVHLDVHNLLVSIAGKLFSLSLEVGPDSPHEAVQYMKMPALLGFCGAMPPAYCPYEPFDFTRTDANKKIVTISDTSKKTPFWEKKRWPYFKELANLFHRHNFEVCLIGGRDEAALFDPSGWPPHINLIGKLSLAATAGAIKASTMFVGNDSGPAHMSGVLGVPTFVLFGPTLVGKNRPLGTNVSVVKLSLPCQPCQGKETWLHCTEWKCLKELKASTVLARILTSPIFDDTANK